MLLKPGDRFGRYVVEGSLGQGGMGAVYRAFDTALQRRVALKVVREDDSTEAAAHAKAHDRLLQEARAAAGIEHVNAIAVHDVGEVDGTTYIAMELVSGRSLRAYVGDATVPIATRVRWLVDIARALDGAHARGLVHRDVKPENVMIREDGVVKVLDFGIASHGGGTGATAHGGTPIGSGTAGAWSMSVTGKLVGTPQYMSPEQLRGEAFDARADQYAWGVTAYELLGGRAPWGIEALTLSALADVQEKDPPPLRKVAPQVPAAVAQVVHRALEKDPERRFPTMGALLAALGTPQGARRRGLRVAVTAALLVLGAGMYAARRTPGPSAAAGREAPTASVGVPQPRLPREDPPSIVLLLDAARGVTRQGDAVSRWQDQSGNGNDAVAGPGDLAPTYVADAAHGLPALHFDAGRYLSIADAPSLQLGTEDFTVEVVARHTRAVSTDLMSGYGSTTGYGLLYCKTLLERPFRGVGLFVNFPYPEPSTRFGAQTSYDDNVISTSEGLNDGRLHLFGLRRRGTALELRVDGVAEASMERPLDDVSAVGRPVFMGAKPEVGGIIQQLQGDIAAVVVVRYPMTPKYFEELEAELKARIGL